MEAQLINPYRANAAHAGERDEDRGLFRSILTWIDETRRYRRTRAELSELSERELADIGLSRLDIEGVARRCARG